MYTPLVLIHICGATVGLLSGYMAMTFRKGSGWHAAAGNVFFVSMLAMSLSGAYIATFLRPEKINVIAALLTFYLITTSWRAAKNRLGTTGMIDVAAMLLATSIGVAALAFGVTKLGKNGPLAAFLIIFGAGALIGALGDLRMLRRGGAAGQQRIVRHLWRMCFALMIATFSFYPGQAKLFPRWLRDTNLLLVPHVLLIGSMIWHRVRMTRKRAAAPKPAQPPVEQAIAA